MTAQPRRIAVDQLTQPLLHSPHLPKVVTVLQQALEEDGKSRQRFYDQILLPTDATPAKEA